MHLKRTRIHDEFAMVPISKQQRWQMRAVAQGLCEKCRTPVLGTHKLCPFHYKWQMAYVHNYNVTHRKTPRPDLCVPLPKREEFA